MFLESLWTYECILFDKKLFAIGIVILSFDVIGLIILIILLFLFLVVLLLELIHFYFVLLVFLFRVVVINLYLSS